MISIFFSDFQIARALKTKLFFCDGTFKVPHGFRQVMNILAFCEDTLSYVPVVHFLLTSKKQTCYELAFNEWKRYLYLHDPNFKPACFTTDFEAAEINAIKECFKCEIIGDNFHFSQALLRNIKKLGLAKKVLYFLN